MSRRAALIRSVAESLDGCNLVIASNRGPVSFVSDGEQPEIKRGAGGLVTAISAVLEATEATWVAAAGTPVDREVAEKRRRIGLPVEDPKYWLRLVPVGEQAYDQHYNQISNSLLWYANHYLWDLAATPVIDNTTYAAWEGYKEVNRAFAKVIADELAQNGKSPVALVQDYHLLLVPGYLREMVPEAVITHFSHTPWPQPDYFRVLPKQIRQEIFHSLLSCNIVGFHTVRYGTNFLWCCQELAGAEVNFRSRRAKLGNRTTLARTYPISIETQTLKSFSESPEVRAVERRLLQRHRDKQILVRVDRAELSKNTLRGFEAFDLLLQHHPDLRERVVFLSYLYPSRGDLEQYRQYVKEIYETVRRLNQKHGTPTWKPIELEIEDDYARSVAALKLYDVLLINPIFDGMNLVAKEGAAVNTRAGVVLLSENAGAYHELGAHALGINPFDVEEKARRIYEALTMGTNERRVRANGLREVVERNDSLKWLYHQLKDTRRIRTAATSPARS